MGMHCACPHAWTGQLCNVPFEICSGSHKRYHGGQCIPGAYDVYGDEQLRCDCYSAMDPATGGPYVGDFCEHRASKFCHYNAQGLADGSGKERFASSAKFAIPSSPSKAARPAGVHPAAPASTASTPEVTDNKYRHRRRDSTSPRGPYRSSSRDRRRQCASTTDRRLHSSSSSSNNNNNNRGRRSTAVPAE